METTIFNSYKGRLVTIEIEYTDQNTTWFEGCESDTDIYMITDFEGGLLVREFGYGYPIYIEGKSRQNLPDNQKKVMELINWILSSL